MDALRARELGMKGGGEHAALAHEHGIAAVPREHLDPRTEVAEARRADEGGGHLVLEAGHGEPCLERVDLAAVGVSLRGGVEQAEAGPGRSADLAAEEDGAGAGAEQRPPRGVEPPQGLRPGLVRHQAEQRRALPAREHEAAQPLELGGVAHLAHLRPRRGQPLRVGGETALEGEDADDRPHYVFELGGASVAPPRPPRRSGDVKSPPRRRPSLVVRPSTTSLLSAGAPREGPVLPTGPTWGRRAPCSPRPRLPAPGSG